MVTEGRGGGVRGVVGANKDSRPAGHLLVLTKQTWPVSSWLGQSAVHCASDRWQSWSIVCHVLGDLMKNILKYLSAHIMSPVATISK